MIRASFRQTDGRITGFTVAGHAGTARRGQDIVCAAVSSAAYMTVNTLTEILHIPTDCTVRDGCMQCTVTDGNESADAVLQGFRLHLEQLAKQYGHRMIITTEV